ncbi:MULTISPECIES: hypothetical protein [unclassified Synechococcus]|uniref:hypothetical protein n=1 Tax=unclassified Synechococcus TaxID=2626047 RepID=UPI00082C4F47|nr:MULTISPECIES: hypothetical protein [unclassified Synechococcus]
MTSIPGKPRQSEQAQSQVLPKRRTTTARVSGKTRRITTCVSDSSSPVLEFAFPLASQSHSVFTTHASTGLQQESLTNWHWLIVIDALPLITRRAHWITVACCEPEELWFSKPTFLLFTRGDESICADNRGTA